MEYKRYFYYSPTAAADMRRIEGVGFKMPWVVSNGAKKGFTEMVTSPSQLRYKDSVKITEGDIRSITYYKG